MRIVVIALALACAVPAIAKPMTKPAPKAETKPLPDHVEEVDYLHTRVAALEYVGAQQELELAQRRLIDAKAKYDRALVEARLQYGMTERDRVSDDPGHKIMRAK